MTHLAFEETMSGTWERRDEPGTARPFRFHVEALGNALVAAATGKVRASGWVEAEGLARHAAIEGEMWMRPWVRRYVRYAFSFEGDDGTRYRFDGRKRIRHLRPLSTWTTLPGTLYDAEGKPVATSVTYFDLRELVPFLLSFRLSSGFRA